MILDSSIGNDLWKVRESWLEKTLKSLKPGMKILDAGAGQGHYKQYCDHLDYVSQDFCQYEGSGDSSGIQTGQWDTAKIDIVSDITEIPVADHSFDYIMCLEVLEHLPDPVKALTEFSRILKPGGSLVLTAPFCSLTHFSPYHFSTGFNKYFYEHHLTKLGFSIEKMESNGSFFSFLAQEIRRIDWCSQKYASYKLTRLERYATRLVLRLLEKIEAKDRASNELLCIGYHVVAIKV